MGILLISIIILFVLRITLSGMTVVAQTGVNFVNMGYWADKLAGEGKVIDAFIIFAISGLLFSFMLTMIMHFIVKIFDNFYNAYSPFLPETVKDLKNNFHIGYIVDFKKQYRIRYNFRIYLLGNHSTLRIRV